MSNNYLKCPKCGWETDDINNTNSVTFDDLGYCQECDTELDGEEPVYIMDMLIMGDDYGCPVTLSFEYDDISKRNLYKIANEESTHTMFTKEQMSEFINGITKAILDNT